VHSVTALAFPVTFPDFPTTTFLATELELPELAVPEEVITGPAVDTTPEGRTSVPGTVMVWHTVVVVVVGVGLVGGVLESW
jgi:hypothetical protein